MAQRMKTMKINEKNVEKLLRDIKEDLKVAYDYRNVDSKQQRIRACMGKVEALLTIVDFEEVIK